MISVAATTTTTTISTPHAATTFTAAATTVNDPGPDLSPFSDESMAATAALFTSSNTTATFDPSVLRDPLKVNLKKQVKALIDVVVLYPEVYPRLPAVFDVLESFVNDGGVDKGKVLDAVSRYLSVPQLVESVVRYFRPLLVDLFARWLEDEEEVREERLVALVYVVEVHEEVFP